MLIMEWFIQKLDVNPSLVGGVSQMYCETLIVDGIGCVDDSFK